MEWLNFHHLRYFWTVAKAESVRKAAEQLHISQPSISAQLKLLEETLGQKLFQRSGRNLVLTEVGHLVLSYADEIFSVGRELMSAVKQRPGNRALRLNVGMTDALSKLIAFEILKPAFSFADPVHIVCRQAEIGPLVNRLQAHRLDIVLADEPASSSLKARTFNHRLGRSGVTFCAVPAIAVKLRRNFPRSLMELPRYCRVRTWACAERLKSGSMRKECARALSGNSRIRRLWKSPPPARSVSPRCIRSWITRR